MEAPILVSTWEHGLGANEAGREEFGRGGSALDAAEAAARAVEADPRVASVGYGGLPDRDGEVTLDACVMDATGRSGAVACLRRIKHAVSVARLVMEKTSHRMLVGRGATQFALDNGFPEHDLLTPDSRDKWVARRDGGNDDVAGTEHSHDTVATLVRSASGTLAGSCTTSGLAWKMPGRVGVSPIVGAGLYVDRDGGAAAGTGQGEHIMATLGSFLIVELMRAGAHPGDACKEAIGRIAEKCQVESADQAAYIAMDGKGEIGAFALRKGFRYAVDDGKRSLLLDADSWS